MRCRSIVGGKSSDEESGNACLSGSLGISLLMTETPQDNKKKLRWATLHGEATGRAAACGGKGLRRSARDSHQSGKLLPDLTTKELLVLRFSTDVKESVDNAVLSIRTNDTPGMSLADGIGVLGRGQFGEAFVAGLIYGQLPTRITTRRLRT